MKVLIAHRFGRAAATYDANADIQRRSLALLLQELPDSAGIGQILELGCGTGNYSRCLLDHYPAARLTALDFAAPMLEQARLKLRPDDSATARRLHLLCADGEEFLVATHLRCDLITANATLQWFADLPRALALIRAGITPGGLLLTTIFGRQSLAELAAGLAAVGLSAERLAARRFLDYPELHHALTAVFPQVTVIEHRLERRFEELGQLLRHFRHTGTAGGGSGLGLGPRRYRELERWFKARPEGLRVSFQVFVVKAAG